jgi:DNA-directed RNA polymerase specialized sigma24 family protein
MIRRDFDRFVADNSDQLIQTAYLIVRDRREAEDLLQETLFKVAKRWPKVSRIDHPVAYARKILVNLALDEAPKRSRRCECQAEMAREGPNTRRVQPDQ